MSNSPVPAESAKSPGGNAATPGRPMPAATQPSAQPTARAKGMANPEPIRRNCSDGALRIANRICAAFPEQHRIILLSGLSKKIPVGLTAVETAQALAMMDVGPVLLVDANPKQAFLGDLLRLQDRRSGNKRYGPSGIAQVLANECEVEDVVLTGDLENLDLLTAGAAIDPRLFLTERCGNVLKRLREQYAFVIVAAAPMLNSPETMRFAVHCDTVVTVLSRGKNSQQELRQLESDLSTLLIPSLGVIFSDR